MSIKIIKRKQAILQGLTRYFTGKPCKRGHLVERYVSTGTCLNCLKDKVKRRGKTRYANDPEFRKMRIACALDYVSRNREKHNKYQLLYREANKDRVLFLKKEHRKNNPDRYKAYIAKRRSLKSSSKEHFSQKDVKFLLNAQKGLCINCRSFLNGYYHIDHIIPLALGGSNGWLNIQLLCPTCNQKKGKMHPIDWAQRNGRLL